MRWTYRHSLGQAIGQRASTVRRRTDRGTCRLAGWRSRSRRHRPVHTGLQCRSDDRSDDHDPAPLDWHTHALAQPHAQPRQLAISQRHIQWRNNRACKACSARGPSAVHGAQNLPDAVFLKFFWGKREPFWNTCTRAHCNLVTPLDIFEN